MTHHRANLATSAMVVPTKETRRVFKSISCVISMILQVYYNNGYDIYLDVHVDSCMICTDGPPSFIQCIRCKTLESVFSGLKTYKARNLTVMALFSSGLTS